jgi:hypothetical protein
MVPFHVLYQRTVSHKNKTVFLSLKSKTGKLKLYCSQNKVDMLKNTGKTGTTSCLLYTDKQSCMQAVPHPHTSSFTLAPSFFWASSPNISSQKEDVPARTELRNWPESHPRLQAKTKQNKILLLPLLTFHKMHGQKPVPVCIFHW